MNKSMASGISGFLNRPHIKQKNHRYVITNYDISRRSNMLREFGLLLMLHNYHSK